jgi:hypothetical protein
MTFMDVRRLLGVAGVVMLGIGWLYVHGLRVLAVIAFLGCGVVVALVIRLVNRDDL